MAERSRYRCPRCREVAWVGRGPDVVLHACGRCRGVWMNRMDAIRLARGLMDERSAQLVGRVDAGQRRVHGYRDAALGDAGRRVCPVCQDELTPTTTHARVEIDVCEEHGVFFDPGEVRTVNRKATATRRSATAHAEAQLMATAAAANLEIAIHVATHNLIDAEIFGPID